jgi:hypothetical protein
MEFSSNGYFFFFLAVFFAFFAFFAFLAMLPSVVPKLAQCKSTIDMHTFRIHHNCKIDTARFEEGKRPSQLGTGRSLACCVDTARIVGSRREEVLMRSEEPDNSEAEHGWSVMAKN